MQTVENRINHPLVPLGIPIASFNSSFGTSILVKVPSFITLTSENFFPLVVAFNIK